MPVFHLNARSQWFYFPFNQKSEMQGVAASFCLELLLGHLEKFGCFWGPPGWDTLYHLTKWPGKWWRQSAGSRVFLDPWSQLGAPRLHGTIGKVCRHFWLLHVGRGLLLASQGGGQRCCSTAFKAKDRSHRTDVLPGTSAVRRLRNAVLDKRQCPSCPGLLLGPAGCPQDSDFCPGASRSSLLRFTSSPHWVSTRTKWCVSRLSLILMNFTPTPFSKELGWLRWALLFDSL